jgi:sugar (pentulose or hexulose) kinase
VLEGCAFQLRYILEELGAGDIDEMAAVGGGAKSPLWLSIIADVTGVALLIPQVLEAGALGAAIYAGVGVGVYPGIREAAEELVQIVGLVSPHAARHRLYESIYGIFVELEDKVSPLYDRTPVGEERVQPKDKGEER